MKKILLLAVILLTLPAQAKHLHLEKEYQAAFCAKNGGVQEYEIEGKRVDCLLNDYAVEVEFAPKRYEAIGQSLTYAALTGKNPAILLIIEKPDQVKYIHDLELVKFKYWTITPHDLR